jgi:hypothetical protein
LSLAATALIAVAGQQLDDSGRQRFRGELIKFARDGFAVEDSEALKRVVQAMHDAAPALGEPHASGLAHELRQLLHGLG